MFLLLLAACSPTVVVALTPADPDPSRDIGYAAPTGFPQITVNCEGGAEFETISDAIDAAEDGDWIEVAPCTYEEGLDYQGKTLWIASTGSSADTILDARNQRAITAIDGTGDGTALVGFTIQNARDSTVAAIYVEQSALRLEDVQIQDSAGSYAIIYASSADLELQDVSIDDSNRVGYYGMLVMSRGSVSADNLSISCPSSTYATYFGHGTLFLDHSDLDCDSGYALVDEHSTGRVHRSTLSGQISIENEDDHYTDGLIFENDVVRSNMNVTYGAVTVRNSILEGAALILSQVYTVALQSSVLTKTGCVINNSFTPPAADTADSGDTAADSAVPDQSIDVSYSDFYRVGHENCDSVTTYSGSDGNIAEDPLFTDADAGDYSTLSGSPLIDAGLPDTVYDDPDGTTNDIGIYGGPRSAGGGW